MRPVLSIFSALIITFLIILGLISIGMYLGVYLTSSWVIFSFVIILGAIIATWFSIENKIRYGLIYGVLSGVFYTLFFHDYILFIYTPFVGLIGGLIANNDKNKIKDLFSNKYKKNYNDFFINLYKRNKFFLMAALLIYLISFIIGGIVPFLSNSFNHFMTNLMINYLTGLMNMVIKINALTIFINNSNIAIRANYISGLFLGILSIMTLVYNGLIIGFQSFKYPTTLIYLLPHVILEELGYIISAAAGFKLLSTVISVLYEGLRIKREMPVIPQLKVILDKNYPKIRDSLILLILAIFVLLIAAIIEANISMKLGNYITGQNIHYFPKYLLNLINS